MKLRDIIICGSTLFAMASGEAFAQIDRNVEVTKAYVPNIEPSNKLMLTPDMSDDTYIMPDIDYSITPISIQSTFDLTPYKASTMNFMEYNSYYPYYVKAGFGFPYESVVDIYASSFNVDQNFVMGYLNQTGRYANIENDYGVEHDGSSQSHLKTGVTAGTYVGERGRLLRGDINYNRNAWSRYATLCDSDYAHPLYQKVAANIQFGDDFASQRGVNFLMRGAVDYFWTNSDYNSVSSGFDGAIGGSLFGGKLFAKVGYKGVSASTDMDNSTLNGGVEYTRYGEKFRFAFGATAYSDKVADFDSELYIIPRLMLDYNLTSTSLIAYLNVDGGLQQNDFASLSRINPYLIDDSFGLKSTVSYDIDLGIKGVIGSAKTLSYNVHFGYDITKGSRYWAFSGAGATSNNYFILSQSDLETTMLKGELEYVPNTSTSITVEAMLANYDDSGSQSFANGLPGTTLSAEWRKHFGKLEVRVSGDYRSARKFSVLDRTDLTQTPTTVTLSEEFDLGAGVNYRVNEAFAIFGDFGNLLNCDLYDWVHYREYGLNVMVGVKFQF